MIHTPLSVFFQTGDGVLVLIPIPGRLSQARDFDRYVVEKTFSDLNYVVKVTDSHKRKPAVSC